MLNPPHLGELIRESMEEVGWSVTETSARLGCEPEGGGPSSRTRGHETLSRLLNGKAGMSANMALALEGIGWGTADHWMRIQANTSLRRMKEPAGGERYPNFPNHFVPMPFMHLMQSC